MVCTTCDLPDTGLPAGVVPLGIVALLLSTLGATAVLRSRERP